MTISTEQADWFKHAFDQLTDNMEKAVLGKRHVIRLTLTCLLSEGHILVEDFPGTGKTMLARALANTVQGSQARIQFTPDLLPSDVTGIVYDRGYVTATCDEIGGNRQPGTTTWEWR